MKAKYNSTTGSLQLSHFDKNINIPIDKLNAILYFTITKMS